jgi:hypothetical protein
VALQGSLLSLAREYDAASHSSGGARPDLAGSLPPVPGIPPQAAERFARLVQSRLEGQILRLQERQLLLRTARRMGIDRFQANLIIAAVQHAHRPAPPAPTAPAPAAPRGWLIPVALFLLIEAVTALCLYRLLAP